MTPKPNVAVVTPTTTHPPAQPADSGAALISSDFANEWFTPWLA